MSEGLSQDEEASLGGLTHWAGRLLRRLADRKLKPLGLTSAHLPVIHALVLNEAMSQKALAEFVAIEQPTMAATLSRMERDGIVKRRPDPADKRGSLYSLSPATRKKIGAIRRAVEEVNQEGLAGLPPGIRPHFRKHLRAMIAEMEKQLAEEG